MPVPRDQGLVHLVDIQDVGLELALFQPGVRCVHAHPVPVAQSIRGSLRLRVPGDGHVTTGGNYVYLRIYGTPDPLPHSRIVWVMHPFLDASIFGSKNFEIVLEWTGGSGVLKKVSFWKKEWSRYPSYIYA